MKLEEVLKYIVKQNPDKWSKVSDTKYKTKIDEVYIFLEKIESCFDPLSDDIISESYPPQKYQVTILNDKETIEIIEEQRSMFESLYNKLLLK